MGKIFSKENEGKRSREKCAAPGGAGRGAATVVDAWNGKEKRRTLGINHIFRNIYNTHATEFIKTTFPHSISLSLFLRL